jgi:lipopolysaccharide transport system permease protein
VDSVTPQSEAQQRETVVERSIVLLRPSRGWTRLRLSELWEARDLIWFLAWRDISARYKQTLVGVSWAVIQPIMAMVVFTIVFGRLAKIPSDGLAYPVFCFAGLLPWQYFSQAVLNSSNSLLRNVHLITKVHFPRLAIPLSAMIPPLFDLAASFLVLFALMFHFDVELTWKVLYVPLFLLLAMVTALGAGLWLAALSVEYRDVQHIVPFLVQLWMFASPVVYSSNLVPLELRPWYGLNPMASVIEGFRWALLGHVGAARTHMVATSAVVAVVLLVTGALYFKQVEKQLADVV